MSQGWDDRTRAAGYDRGYDRGRDAGYDRGRDAGYGRGGGGNGGGYDRPPRRSSINAGRLWSGGVAAAIIAALIAFLALLLVRVLLQIPYLAPTDTGALAGGNTTTLCVSAALAALAATALAHLLLVSVPSPMSYFGWIAGLLTAVAAILPLLSSETLAVRITTGIIHLVIGVAIISLVTTAAMAASNR
ncbi:DUF6069 family protein [Pseudonocardia endophytica]|uniref:Uncharacterized protein n=1 Tax=Pseudonocardia endophytica TaxID=401976 RepID=A0A4R1HLJ0_PSEEN|nr:DUF6069 family protein [Pseudonocardia endophytica]TCK21893.1 hypothetical protein EV378_5885 [Pseudonocardia endophytica]